MRSSSCINDDPPPNNHYETDVRRAFQFCHWVWKPLGIYAFVYNCRDKYEKMTSVVLILISYSILQFVIVPFGYYTLFYERDIDTKIKFMGPLAFCLSTLIKYGYLAIKSSEFGRCVKHVKEDWRMLRHDDHRAIMIRYLTMGRKLITLCAAFMYTGGLSYHTIMPLLSKKISENVTIRPLTYPGYEAFFDVQKSPTYEIVYCMHCVYVLISGNITMAAYSLTAICTTHTCGQIKIQTSRLKNLREDRKALENGIEDCLAVVVREHAKILRFTEIIETALQELFLIEVVTSTLLMCLLEYYCMIEWETSDSAAISTYFMLLTSFTFNIFIYCYVGELLLGQIRVLYQGSEIATALYDIEWYNLAGKKARDIVLVLAISKYPLKLRAGKMLVLSMNTFGVVLKTSLVYLNMLRTITEL